MGKLIILVLSFYLFSCSSAKKCSEVDGFNPVVDPGCQVRIKNVFFADQVSSDIKDKINRGQQVEYIWIPTERKGDVVVPAHYEVKTVLGDGL
jgi:hypothetical protein